MRSWGHCPYHNVSLFNKCSPTLDIGVCVPLAKSVPSKPPSLWPQALTDLILNLPQYTQLAWSWVITTGGKYIGFFSSNMEWMRNGWIHRLHKRLFKGFKWWTVSYGSVLDASSPVITLTTLISWFATALRAVMFRHPVDAVRCLSRHHATFLGLSKCCVDNMPCGRS